MADPLDRFTRRARQALTLAQEEAQRLNHSRIGTEHLLIGLIRTWALWRAFAPTSA